MLKTKLFILGHGRGGKDVAATQLKKDIGLSFESSSYFAARLFLFDKLKVEFGYETIEECFSDRHSEGMRKRWHNEICEYNLEDKIKLVKAIFNEFDCYVGLRSGEELLTAKEFYGNDLFCIWIDAEGRIEPESEDSCTVTKEMCDIVIENKLDEESFLIKVAKLGKLLKPLLENN